jgi:hypothetical protein
VSVQLGRSHLDSDAAVRRWALVYRQA